jgi:transcription-repair coupling factor (superfamily II helicase)
VNTILVEDAQKFGLAQLYQLRGRVGRSGIQAHAW